MGGLAHHTYRDVRIPRISTVANEIQLEEIFIAISGPFRHRQIDTEWRETDDRIRPDDYFRSWWITIRPARPAPGLALALCEHEVGGKARQAQTCRRD